MISNIDEETKKRAKVDFDAYLEIEDRKKELKAEHDAVVGDTAELLDVKKTVITKLFKALKKKMDGEDNPDDEVDQIIETVFRN
jgi:uncharacterized protein (AIM24 family)